MNTRRTYLRAPLVYAVMLCTGWAGWPSVGCICANGGFKLLCGVRSHAEPVELSRSPKPVGDCCRNGDTAQTSDPANGVRDTSCPSGEFAGRDCTPMAGTWLLAPPPATQPAAGDRAIAFDSPTIHATDTLAVVLSSLDTSLLSPPRDLVVCLHTFLI